MPSRLSPEGFKPLADTVLFTPVQIGALKLEHRIVQSPLTRMRGTKESEGVWACGDINVEYYAQRASKGGFQITEATNISRLVSFGSPSWLGSMLRYRSAVVILEFPVFSQPASLPDGSVLQTLFIPKEDSFIVRSGMSDARLYLP
jgi:hypothetical protein